MIRLICLAVGYLFGLIQTSYIYGRMQGIDIRTQGSGNAGTTNALRVLGKKAGAITFVGDACKCIAAILLVRLLFSGSYPDMVPLLCVYTGAGVVLGHNFPFYLGFRGGKGIAASGGMMLAFGDFRIFLICLFGFILAYSITNYVSLGSLVLYACFMIQIVIFGQHGDFSLTEPRLTELYAVVGFLTLMAFWQHRANIGRLLRGTENKTYLFRKKKEDRN